MPRLRPRTHAWLIAIPLGGIATLAYQLTGAVAVRVALAVAMGAGVAVAVGVGVRLHRPRHRGPYDAIAAALLCSALGKALAALDGSAATAVGSLAALLAFPLAIGGVLALARHRRFGGAEVALDAALVASAMGVLAWTALLDDAVRLSSLSASAQVVPLLSPLLSVALLAAVLPKALRPGEATPATLLAGAAVALAFVGDVGFARAVLLGTAGPDSPHHLAWHLFATALAAAVLHPSMASWSGPGAAPNRGVTRAGHVLLGASVGVVPLAIWLSGGEATAVVLLGVLLIPGLVVARLVLALRTGEQLVAEVRASNARIGVSEQRFRVLFDHSPEPVWSIDLEGRFTSLNPAGEALLAARAADLVGHHFHAALAPGAHAAVDAQLGALWSGEPITFTTTVRRSDGERRDLEVIGIPILEDGVLVGAFGLGSDVTAARRATRDLARRSAQQAVLVELGQRAAASPTVDALLAEATGTLHATLDAEAAELWTVEGDDLVPAAPAATALAPLDLRALPEVAAALEASDPRVLSAPLLGHLTGGTTAVVPLDGTEAPALLAVHTTDPDGFDEDDLLFLHAVANILSATVARTAQAEAAAELLALHELALTAGDVHLWELDADGRFRLLTEAPSLCVGATADWWRLVQAADQPAARAWLARVLAGERGEEVRLRLVGELGEVRHVVCSGRLHTGATRPTAVIGVLRDVTEQRRAEEQLIQSQKLEAVGRLAGGIAHDFNNLLTAMTGYTEVAQSLLPPGSPAADVLDQVGDAAARATTLVDQLLSFSRRRGSAPVAVDADRTLEAIGAIVRRLTGDDIAVHASLGAPDALLSLPEGQLEQIVINLAVNARDAMPGGGRLELATRVVEVDADAAARDGVAPGHHLELTAADTGCGIDPAVLDHVFEPFFTTKPEGEGTGLGLSTVYGIVVGAGGTIGAASTPDVGTTFTVRLPLTDAAAPVPQQPRPAPIADVASGTGTVLLVEDQPQLRHLFSDALGRAGYAVVAAADGAEALARVRDGAVVDLVLTDVVMPEMSGPALVEALRADGHDLRAIFMSGYVAENVLPAGGATPDAFLQKPFGLGELISAVRDGLAVPA